MQRHFTDTDTQHTCMQGHHVLPCMSLIFRIMRHSRSFLVMSMELQSAAQSGKSSCNQRWACRMPLLCSQSKRTTVGGGVKEVERGRERSREGERERGRERESVCVYVCVYVCVCVCARVTCLRHRGDSAHCFSSSHPFTDP